MTEQQSQIRAKIRAHCCSKWLYKPHSGKATDLEGTDAGRIPRTRRGNRYDTEAIDGKLYLFWPGYLVIEVVM